MEYTYEDMVKATANRKEPQEFFDCYHMNGEDFRKFCEECFPGSLDHMTTFAAGVQIAFEMVHNKLEEYANETDND